jgi:tetratricopeptide (TPR) repeat protein
MQNKPDAKPTAGTTQVGDTVDTDGGDYIAGDKNTVDVDRAENVVIESAGATQTTFNIGSLAIPRRVLAVLATGGAVLGTLFAGLLVVNTVSLGRMTQPTVTPGPTTMSGALNIAIAQFSTQDSQKTQLASPDGLRYSTMLYASLKEELKDAPNIQLWHDSLGNDIKGVNIGVVPGASESERRQNAAELAKRIGADMVIFGVMSQTDEDTVLKPEFYVASSNEFLKASPEAADILGSRALGPPINITLPFTRSTTGVLLDHDIKARTLMVRGIVNDLTGLHAAAFADFKRVRDMWTERGVPGEETLHYFLGREALFLARDKNASLAISEFGSITATHAFAEAQFSRAVESDPNYALGWWGLGTARLKKAELVITNKDSLPEIDVYKKKAQIDLDAALANYEEALKRVNVDERPILAAKIETSKANALRLKSLAALDAADYATSRALSEQARELLTTALARLNNNQSQARAIATATYLHAMVLINDSTANDKPSAQKSLREAKVLLDACMALKAEDLTLRDYQNNNCAPAHKYVTDNMEAGQ